MGILCRCAQGCAHWESTCFGKRGRRFDPSLHQAPVTIETCPRSGPKILTTEYLILECSQA